MDGGTARLAGLPKRRGGVLAVAALGGAVKLAGLEVVAAVAAGAAVAGLPKRRG